jgi:hypothetical protein
VELEREAETGEREMSGSAESPHAVLYLNGDAIVAHHRPRIAQATSFALDDKAPQRIARILHQPGAHRAALRVRLVVFGQIRKRGFKRPSEPAERSRLLLRDFVVERDDARHPRT